MASLIIQIVGILATALVALAAFLAYKHTKLINFLINEKPHNILPFATTSLASAQIGIVFISFFVKPLLQSLGGQSSVISIARSNDEAPSKQIADSDATGPQLPRLSLQMPFRISLKDLKKYQGILTDGARNAGANASAESLRSLFIGSEVATTSSACHLSLLLSALSESAMLLLLAKQNCPIQPLGAVNVRNRFEFRRPDLVKAILSRELESSGSAIRGTPKALWQSWFAIAKCLPQSRIVKRGYECDLEVKILCLDDGEEVNVFRQVFTMLQFARHNQKVPEGLTGSAADMLPSNENGESISFSVSGSTTFSWAQLCKDFNPIHISGIAAKTFGFSWRIAHGNLVVARAVYALSPAGLEGDRINRRDEAESNDSSARKKICMEIQFRRPVVVPAKLEVRATEAANSRKEFSVSQKGKLLVAFQFGDLSIRPPT